MLQFEKNSWQYAKIRKKITYPTALYQKLSDICQQHKRALDMGCGNGVSTIGLQPFFSDVKGIDIGETLIQHARNTYPTLHFDIVSSEVFKTTEPYDLITSATSFYWMDRAMVTKKMANLLSAGGVFCAYKYDFPIAYGKLCDFLTHELTTKWTNYRDQRLIDYDNTLEILEDSRVFDKTAQFIIPNIVELTSEEVAHFFLSTSYVTKYIEETGDKAYYTWFIKQCQTLEPNLVNVNFDIYAYYGKKK